MKAELLAAEEEGWAVLCALVERFSREELGRPGYFEEGWSVRDLMAHLGCWLAEAARVLERIRAGTYSSERLDVDAMNAEFARGTADLSLDEVRSLLAASRNEMLAALDALTEVGRPAREWFEESGARHYQEHLPRLREWVEAAAAAPGGRRRLGVMGGTFDPIHHGHLVTAEEALWQFRLDEVVFVPTGRPWMKSDRHVSPAEDRYLMTVIATAGNPFFSVSRVEVEREGPSYTVETLEELRRQSGGETDLFFITGADALLEIFQWKDPEEVLASAHFIAATRPGHDLAGFESQAGSHPNVSVMSIPALSISSTDIRRRVRERKAVRYLVPEGVQTYIQKAGLYLEDA